MKRIQLRVLLALSGAMAACRSAADVPRNPSCVPFRDVRFSRSQTNALETFLAYASDGVMDSGERPDYRRFCYRFEVPDGAGRGLLRITNPNRSHWGYRLVVKTPQHLLFVSPVRMGQLPTYTTTELAAACHGQLSERACAELAEYLQH